jgi:peptidyl-prolyl cis-trans isomerase SurA
MLNNLATLRLRFLFFLLFSLLGKLYSQPGKAGVTLPPQYADGILAVVGDQVILHSDFETEKVQLARGQILTDTVGMYCYVLEQLITRKLLLSQAEIDSLPLDNDRIEAEIDNRIRNFQRQAGSIQELERYLGKTIQEFKDEIRPKMRDKMLSEQMEGTITGSVKISPQEVQEFYREIPEDSLPVIPTEVEVAQLLFELPISKVSEDFAVDQLNDLKRRIARGESFEKLARAYSMDPGSKNNGGMLPEFGRGEMVGAFERMAFKLKEDSISEVFKTDFGYHIMQLKKRKGERILAAHILIRPENTSEDYMKASQLADSVYQLIQDKKLNWCDAVKNFSSEKLGNRGYCGFLIDQNTGLQKNLFEALPTDIKQVVEKMKEGEYSKPAISVTPDGRSLYRILYLKKFVAPHKANLIQDYSRIQMEAEIKKKQEVLDKWVEKFRKKTYIKVIPRDINCENLARWNHE